MTLVVPIVMMILEVTVLYVLIVPPPIALFLVKFLFFFVRNLGVFVGDLQAVSSLGLVERAISRSSFSVDVEGDGGRFKEGIKATELQLSEEVEEEIIEANCGESGHASEVICKKKKKK